MDVTTETEEYLEYVCDGFTYTIHKSDPPRISVTYDYSNPRFYDKPQTWLELKAMFDITEMPT